MGRIDNGIGITKGLQTWHTQNNTVERMTDDATYTAAHPDDTLVLAGPPRLASVWTGVPDGGDLQKTEGWNSLMALGFLQGFNFQTQRPVQPLQAIGSGRSYFVTAKSQVSWSMGRLFCNGRNLMRALYHSAAAAELPVEKFDETPSARGINDMYFVNMDSELFYIPIGIAAVFKDKAHNILGSVYLELSMIAGYGVGFNAGQALIMENVSGLCDRVRPFLNTQAVKSNTNWNNTLRAQVDKVVGLPAAPEGWDEHTIKDGPLDGAFLRP
jgi:hypothetical protein